LIIFIFLFFLILVVVRTHQVAIQSIDELCSRLGTLEKALEMKEYHSADLLKIALPITYMAAIAALLFNLIIILFIIFYIGYCWHIGTTGIFNPPDLLDHRLINSVNIFNLV